ncbi:MAG: ABC-2 type transport system permease protein [Janthinobacterium sp.]|jgi:ABC-2 type transport system permease protein
MKTMQWLVRRELWEHQGMLLRAPLVVAILMALFVGVMLLSGHNMVFSFNGQQATLTEAINGAYLSDVRKSALLAMMAGSYMAASAPIFLMLGFLVFFYCLSALHDERMDRSLLFWKSLPVSDSSTVLSKALVALVVAPAIAIAIGTALSLLLLLMLCIALALKGLNLFPALLSMPALYLTPLRVVALLPIYVLWALPTVGWLLMVSSWARSKVFLWAVGAPLLSGAFALWADKAYELGWNGAWFMQDIVARVLLGATPGAWLLFDQQQRADLMGQAQQQFDLAGIVSHSWMMLGSANLWLGVLAGCAMMGAAIRLRRWREEV